MKKILMIHRSGALNSKLVSATLNWYAHELRQMGHVPVTLLDGMTVADLTIISEETVLRHALSELATCDALMTIDMVNGDQIDSAICHMARCARIDVVPCEAMVKTSMDVFKAQAA